MTSQIRVDEITNRSGLGTVTIYDNGFEFTGVTTFTEDVDINGGLTIGGVLTYEDTTNIDSVGLITARAGIRVIGDSIHVESSEDRLLYLKSTDANAYLTFEDTDSSSAFANRVGTVSDGLYFSTGGGGERLRIRNDGKISAGTALDVNNSYEFSIRGADGTGCLYAHGRNHYLSTRSTSHASLTVKKSNADSDGIDYLQFRDSANAAKFVVNGDGTLQILDSIKHMGDTDTLISFPANDTITLRTNGSERLRIDSNGLVGIDVTSPATNLDVNGILQLRASGNTTYATRIYSRLDSTHCSVIESYLNSNTAFEMIGSYADGGGANPRVVISAGGQNVGINTTDPSSKLHINNGGNGSSAIEIDADYLTVSPSLNLDFAKSRKLDGRIHFHRDSIGTYFDANGLLKVAGLHEPRFDHDPKTGQSLGLMIEETRTNHVNSSENPSAWNVVHTAANETTYKIKGIPTVKLIDGTGDGDSPYLSGGTYGNGKVTMSMYIDAVNSTSSTVRMYLFGNGYGTIAWSLSGNVAATTGGFSYNGSNHSNGVAQTIDCGGGIYRLVMTFDYSGGNTTSRFYVTPSGADSDYVYIAGMQLESGGFATSYIPTSGTPVTRSQDRAEIKYDGWYNDESYKKPSTFAGRFRTYDLSATRMVAEGSNGSTLKDFSMNTIGNSAQLQFAHRYTASNSYGNTSNAGVSINTDVNFAFSYDGTDGSLVGSANRSTPFTGTDDLGTTSQIGGDRMRIGSRGNNSLFLNGTIAQLRYFPVQATSAQLLAQQ